MQAIYQAREQPPTTCFTVTFADDLAAFKQRCEQHRDSRHDKTKALARELLTNNEAERALRHWVIARLITQGTRTSQGTCALGLLPSVIETYRKRNILPWPYLALVITERRKGNPASSLPPMALAV